MSHLPCNNQIRKCINNQQISFNIYNVFYSQYSQQHFSAAVPTSVPQRQHTAPMLWIKTHHITALIITRAKTKQF
jgi:hypothetical protein